MFLINSDHRFPIFREQLSTVLEKKSFLKHFKQGRKDKGVAITKAPSEVQAATSPHGSQVPGRAQHALLHLSSANSTGEKSHWGGNSAVGKHRKDDMKLEIPQQPLLLSKGMLRSTTPRSRHPHPPALRASFGKGTRRSAPEPRGRPTHKRCQRNSTNSSLLDMGTPIAPVGSGNAYRSPPPG